MDSLDKLALLRALVDVLDGENPDGEWKKHPLLHKWHQSQFALTPREMTDLCNYLDRQRRLAEIARYQSEYKQLSVLDEGDKS